MGVRVHIFEKEHCEPLTQHCVRLVIPNYVQRACLHACNRPDFWIAATAPATIMEWTKSSPNHGTDSPECILYTQTRTSHQCTPTVK